MRRIMYVENKRGGLDGDGPRTAGTTRRNDERVRGRARSRPRPSA
ncbi:hypothetical protein [Sorangium sp. So ce426]